MKKIHHLLLILLIFSSTTFAQTITCPPNIDFENANYGYWKFFTGTCCPISVNTSPQTNNRHTLTTGNSLDPVGGFPIVAPGGGSYSLKLGNTGTGAQAERASYSVYVPQSVNNYSLIYRYAVVFQDPGHISSEQPRFEVSTIDSNTNTTISCNNFSYVASSSLPGFTCNGGVCYRGWATASLNLTGFNGHTIIVNFSTGDCDVGGHYGYGYVDLSCSLFQISSTPCNATATQALNAPPGFQQYIWYDSNYVNIIAQGANIIVPTPPISTKFNVVLIPYPGYGCPDTLSSIVNVSTISTSTVYDTVCNNSNPYSYTNSGIYLDTFVNTSGCDSIITLHYI